LNGIRNPHDSIVARVTEAAAGDVRLSVVVPCYRDEDNVGPLLQRLDPVLRDLDGTCEIVLVDDGSPDSTGERAVELSRGYPHPVSVVRLARNFGQHPAVFAGLAHARGDVVVTMDSDMQYRPEDIPLLLGALEGGAEVASGVRAQRNDPWGRRMITRGLSWWLGRQTGTPLADFGSMFRAYRRPTVDRMLLFTERHRYVPALVAWLGADIVEVPITHDARGSAGSRYRIGPLVDMLLDLVTGYAVFPLRVLSALGVAGALVGFISSLIFLVYRVVKGGGGAGTVSAFALIFGLLAMVLLVVALLGEYVGRIYTESKARPYYVVGEVVRNAAPVPADR
jgi:undecaprenyl-phosphate 4-deoxy-4-formamido-L-arabinose transferase